MENMVDTELKPLYVVVNENFEVTELTFEETDYYYQDVPVSTEIQDLELIIDIKHHKIFWRDGCLIDEGQRTDEEILINSLKKQIEALEAVIDAERNNTQEIIFEIMQMIGGQE